MAFLSKENYNPEEYLLDTLNDLDIGFVKVSNDGIILNHNLTFNKIFGYNPEKNLINTKILDYWLNSEEINSFREELFKNGIVKKYIAPAKKLDGEKIFLQMNIKLNKNSNGEIISSERSFTDVTKRIRTEQQLKESEEKWRALSENSPAHVLLLDREHKIIFINRTVPDLSKEEVIGTSVFNYTPQEFHKAKRDCFNSVWETGEPSSFHQYYKTKEDDIRFFDIWIGPVFQSGKIVALVAHSMDITENKKAEQKLRESEHNLAERVKELTFLYELSKLVENSSISVEEIIDRTLNLIPPAWEFPDITTARILYDNRIYSLENCRETDWKLSCKVIIYDIPMVIEVFYLEDRSFLKEETALLEEIGTRLKIIIEEGKAQKKVKESEEKYRMLFESSTDGIASVDMDGRIIDVNNVFLKMLGYSKEELLRLNFRDITPQKWHEMEDNLIASQLSGASDSVIYEKEYIKKDGTILPINARIWIIKDTQGDPVRRWGIARDITDRKKKEKEIFDLALFPSEDPYPVLRVNRTGIIYINEAGQNLLNIVDYNQIPKFFQESVKNTFESNKITESEVEFDSRIYSFTITPVKDADYVNIYGMDITERKQVEEKLKEVNKLKSEFLRRASHELKTPLISIKGFSDLILSLYSDQLDTPIISKLREINDGCERLQNIINNLLKTSRLESPDLKPKVQKEDLSFLIKFCVNELQSLSERRKQSINLDIRDKLFANIEKEEIHDVLSNLLTNAIKYTPPMGKIEVKTELKDNNVVVSVSDNGIGFTEEEKKRIFKQFGKIERYGQGLDLGIDGTGLGLYISKRIVESHEGKIWMESEGNSKGSTFYFTLPTAK